MKGPAPLLLPWRGTAEACLAAFAECRPRWALRGERLRTKAGLMNEWAAAAQLPPYFGATWDALRDALADLPEGGTFLVLGADQLLQDAPPGDFSTLVAVLQDVQEDLAPRPFQLVLQAEPEHYGTLIEGLQVLGLG